MALTDAFPTTGLSGLNSALASFNTDGGLAAGGYGLGYSQVVPPTYDQPAAYAAPINSNTVGTAPVVSDTGQTWLDALSSAGMRLVSSATDAASGILTAKVNAAQKAQTGIPGAQLNISQQFIPGVPNLVLFALGGFLIYKAVK